MTSRSWHEFLRGSAIPRRVIEDFIRRPRWVRFDPELGYRPAGSVMAWGIDGSRTIETIDRYGARAGTRWPGVRPRINTYGDAFTESPQQSDGETWQEYLAAHLGEPVGNFGISVSGVYQAYRRMRREESANPVASLAIIHLVEHMAVLGILRNAWVGLTQVWREYALARGAFHGAFWPVLELDTELGRFTERENPLRTPDDLFLMSDPDWMVAALEDDLALRLFAHSQGLVDRADGPAVEHLAELLGRPGGPAEWADSRELFVEYARATAFHALCLASAFATERGIRLLVVIGRMDERRAPGDFWRDVPDRLAARGIEVLDTADAHDAARRGAPADEHFGSHILPGMPPGVRHPTAQANHFLAYAIKDRVVALLDRKPPSYRDDPAGLVAPVLDSAAPGWLEPLLEQLRSRYAEPWTPASLAAVAHRSRSTFYADFTAAVGITPMEHVKRIRLDAAARILRESTATVDAIAGDVGFATRHHFSREFGRRFGTTPTRYRLDARS